MSTSPQTLPLAFSATLLTYLKQNYLKKGRVDSPWNARDTEYFARGVSELHDAFTETRSSKAQNYLNDPILRSGYLAYFLPINTMKAYRLLSRFLPTEWADEIHVADVGAGPCSLSLAFLFFMADTLRKNPKRILVHLDLFEQNRKVLTDGKNILQEYLRASGLEEHVTVVTRDFTASFHNRLPSKTKYDFILLGNILNEFDSRDSQNILAQNILFNSGAPGTLALFLEPSSKKSSRDLQALRDTIIETTPYQVLAPCLHQLQCPLNLTAKGDWCHFQETWQIPDFIRDFDTVTGLKKSYLQFSYLLLRQSQQAAPAYTPDTFVAISDILPMKNRFDVLGCGPAGRVRFIQMKNDMSPVNAGFNRLRRGAVFQVAPYKNENEFSLDRNVSVTQKTKIKIL